VGEAGRAIGAAPAGDPGARKARRFGGLLAAEARFGRDQLVCALLRLLSAIGTAMAAATAIDSTQGLVNQ